MAQSKSEKGEAKARQKADEAKARTASKNTQEERDAEERRAAEADRDEARALNEEQATANPATTNTMEANYDPTGQIVQPGQPLHSTDPEEQAAFEQERQEAIRRSQMGERLGAEDAADVREGDRPERLEAERQEREQERNADQ